MTQFKDLPEDWDVIVIGGGITGAGILLEAGRMGLRVLLLERNDFAWGTSSRSTKLIHGGFRYLKEGKIGLTRASVEERERLLRAAPGLVERLGFLLPVYHNRGPGRCTLGAGFALYDLIARKWDHRFYDPEAFCRLSPHVNREGLAGGFRFFDAQADDARLVLRLITEAGTFGSHVEAINYVEVSRITRDASGRASGILAMDREISVERVFRARAVINATGAWAETLHPSPNPECHLRPLRGSHLVFPSWIMPTSHALSFFHPADNRPVAVIPWEGALLVGTTDIDYEGDLEQDPAITPAEISYLLEGLGHAFPGIRFSEKDCFASFAGIRPVLSYGKCDPCRESREHVIWVRNGLVTITGGKLTTFRRLALDALKAARPFLPSGLAGLGKGPLLRSIAPVRAKKTGLPVKCRRRLSGRYGSAAEEVIRDSAPEDLETVPGTNTLWAELRFAAEHEQVRHLSDLLLRRVRIGLVTPEGGAPYLDRIQHLCAPVLPWDAARWQMERAAYEELWKKSHAVPDRRKEVPDP
ncbi:MAG TPA: glycerol-3-phosphate dehydrogenase/oxidase [Desulfobacteraceae bacterium]|nr:glycerol-3-phosphate dehydrogenase/oxidase [Desulfobacteraceae bacterium]